MADKAVFVDRDGTIVGLVYDKETGYVDSITRPEQVRLLPGAAEALKRLKDSGYKLILVSNKPEIAKGRVDEETFWETQRVIEDRLRNSSGVEFDGIYFCLHHPQAIVEKYRADCECRKPKPGLILKAAKEHDLDIKNSYMVGDDILDIKAGRAAGCKAIMLGHANSTVLQILDDEGLKVEGIVGSLNDASRIILSDSHGSEWIYRRKGLSNGTK
ncbi:MAG: HAD family hydrolase [Conexivisphaerales archaeon]